MEVSRRFSRLSRCYQGVSSDLRGLWGKLQRTSGGLTGVSGVSKGFQGVSEPQGCFKGSQEVSLGFRGVLGILRWRVSERHLEVSKAFEWIPGAYIGVS